MLATALVTTGTGGQRHAANIIRKLCVPLLVLGVSRKGVSSTVIAEHQQCLLSQLLGMFGMHCWSKATTSSRDTPKLGLRQAVARSVGRQQLS